MRRLAGGSLPEPARGPAGWEDLNRTILESHPIIAMNSLDKVGIRRPVSPKCVVVLLTLVCLLSSGRVAGQTPQKARTPDALHQLNDSIETLVQRVSPSVVQILVTGYGSASHSRSGADDRGYRETASCRLGSDRGSRGLHRDQRPRGERGGEDRSDRASSISWPVRRLARIRIPSERATKRASSESRERLISL